MIELKLCLTCGFTNEDDPSFCEKCGSKLTENPSITLNDESIPNNNILQSIVKIIAFFFISFSMDIITLDSLIKIYNENQLNNTNLNIVTFIIPFIPSFIEFVLFYRFLSIDISNSFIEDTLFITVPMAHFVILNLTLYLYANNPAITYALNTLVASGFVVGAFHLYYRIIKIFKPKGPLNRNTDRKIKRDMGKAFDQIQFGKNW